MTDAQLVGELVAEARRLQHAGSIAEAEQLCRRVLQLDPNNPDALYRLARIAQFGGRPAIAAALMQRLVATVPASRGYLKVLGDILLSQGKPAQALASYRLAMAVDASDAETQHNLALALFHQGEPEQAVANVRAALALAPERAELHSNLLLMLQYVPDVSRDETSTEAVRWAAQHIGSHEVPVHSNVPDPNRRLRIGYVSADFRQHPVALFIEPVLQRHDGKQVEVFCYSNNLLADEMTERLRSYADGWRTIAGMKDSEAETLIRKDEIDILVDLAGHTAGNRLTLLARKPAPVQATWAGYSDTTGLAAIDYFLGDRYICPPGEEHFFTERVARLPAYFLCYQPQPDVPPVAPSPAKSQGSITFGCFNALTKLNSDVVRLWSEILARTGDSRLYLKADAFADPGVRDHFRQLFVGHGIPSERLILERRASSWRQYMEAFSAMDIALDPFPFNGGTTSMDGLWMGVPLVSLSGDQGVSRFGKGILCTIGLSDLVAHTSADYKELAIALAKDRDRLADLRRNLRSRMARSALCDSASFTRALEELYRGMWLSWCRGR